MNNQCPSVHIWSGQRCIKVAGHDGICCGKMQPSPRAFCSTRAEWYSENGEFKSHHRYHSIYGRNMSAARRGGGKDA